MIDITTAIEVPYGNDQTAYAYRDRVDEQLWYIVPVPRVRTIDGAPVFSVNKYTRNGGGIAGACTFQTELVVPEEAKEALRALRGDVQFGGYTWVGGSAFFHYQIEGVSQIETADPTLYGTNVATFHITLPNAQALTEFVDSLSKGGGASPFSIEYDMQVLTQLLGAEAYIKYDATAAISYEEKYHYEKDTWGKQKRVLDEVKQVLQQSDAGTVKVTLGEGGTPELDQRVHDWAWTTLETQVADTIVAATAMAQNTDNPVTASTSFERTYTKDVVVDWSTPVTRAIDVFSPEVWKDIYREIDNRSLSVTFALVGQMTRTKDDLAIAEQVTITVDYPTRQTGNTFELVPGNGAQSSHVFEAPGDFSNGSFNPAFRYKYTVAFDKGSRYESDWITADETLINLNPGDFGTRQVTFVGQGVPFDDDDGVDKVAIDFFFAPPEGHDAVVQVKELSKNGSDPADVVTFNSYYNLPIGATYHYRLRYLMKDGQIVTSGAPVSFSSAPDNTLTGNADVVFVPNPSEFSTEFQLRAFNRPNSEEIADVSISAQYFDEENNSGTALFHQAWNGWMPDPDERVDTAKPTWRVSAVDNTNTAFFKLSGSIVWMDGRQVNLGSKFFQPSGNQNFLIFSDSEPYSVEIFTNAIDWDDVEAVNLTFFRLEEIARRSMADGVPHFLGLSRADMTRQQREIAEQAQRDVYAFSLIKAPDGQKQDDFRRHYALKRPRDQAQLEFFYTAEYILKKNGESRWLREQEVEGVLSVNLPPLPDAGGTPGVVRQRIDAALLADAPATADAGAS